MGDRLHPWPLTADGRDFRFGASAQVIETRSEQFSEGRRGGFGRGIPVLAAPAVTEFAGGDRDRDSPCPAHCRRTSRPKLLASARDHARVSAGKIVDHPTSISLVQIPRTLANGLINRTHDRIPGGTPRCAE